MADWISICHCLDSPLPNTTDLTASVCWKCGVHKTHLCYEWFSDPFDWHDTVLPISCYPHPISQIFLSLLFVIVGCTICPIHYPIYSLIYMISFFPLLHNDILSTKLLHLFVLSGTQLNLSLHMKWKLFFTKKLPLSLSLSFKLTNHTHFSLTLSVRLL